MEFTWTNPEDVEHWFHEIDLTLEEKRAVVEKLKALEPISVNNSLQAWDAIYNVDGIVYRVYGPITDWEFDERNLIVWLEPIDRQSGR